MTRCDICLGPLNDKFGHNTEPILPRGSRCCKSCDAEVMIARDRVNQGRKCDKWHFDKVILRIRKEKEVEA